jgi:hypothetical protein
MEPNALNAVWVLKDVVSSRDALFDVRVLLCKESLPKFNTFAFPCDRRTQRTHYDMDVANASFKYV